MYGYTTLVDWALVCAGMSVVDTRFSRNDNVFSLHYPQLQKKNTDGTMYHTKLHHTNN